MIVQITFLSVLVVGSCVYILLGEDTAEQVLGVLVLVIDLHFVHLGVAFHVSSWANNFLRALPELVREVLRRRHVPLLELALLHTVADEEVVRHTSLVKFDIIGVVLVLLLIEQILLGPLGDIVVEQRVTLVEFALMLRDARPVRFLFTKSRMKGDVVTYGCGGNSKETERQSGCIK